MLNKKIFYFILGSIFLHLIGMLSLEILNSHLTRVTPYKQPITLEIVHPDENSEIKKVQIQKDLDDSKNKQIVDQDERPINNEIDERTKFLSKNNQKVEKQTIAKNHGKFQNKQEVKLEASKPGDKNSNSNPQKMVNGQKRPLQLKDFAPKYDLQSLITLQKSTQKKLQKGSGDKAQKAQGKTQDGSQTLDYIKELDPGLETMLSTREFVYYSYYNRIRGQLSQYWEPMVREKMQQLYQQGRTIASTDDKITKVLIVLDKNGKLIKVQIIGNSGIRDLDEAAAEAFRSAAPFPNPPTGMIEPDGTIRIRWDFILEA
jgi:TonB family protein